ncbi:MAG: hypothetical protein DMG57_01260 [Acidobacteria bacterium]|nr:MAG: hypothetical protein DMG57_01260 [Acidobacteriota bacterium]
MNRRQFVASVGALSIPASLAVAAPQTPGAPRSRVSLNGRWERHVNGALLDYVDVPSSLRPSGFYRLKRTILLPKLLAGQRAFVRFEAINFHGRVFVNDAELGTTIPYVPHEFDFTRHAREGTNTVDVDVADLLAEPGGAGADEVWLGVNPGWEAYGGIIRDAFVELRPSAFLDNLRFVYRLGPQDQNAQCRVTAWISAAASAASGRCEIALMRGAHQVARAEKQIQLQQGMTEAEFEFSIDNPALWSPDDSNLYTLNAALHSDSGTDSWSCRTGFRDTSIRGRSFLLNGEPILLNGVCRHDMWKNQGFTLTRAQMEQDLRGIKAMGANFIRLVHYPHDRYIIDLADELGLLVSEEPGYWNVDFRKMPWSQAELGLRIMERVARRDWNSPSIFAWLFANESTVTAEYLRKGKELFRTIDPQNRFLSMANSMRKEDAKPLCEATGMDFFDDHPYTFDVAQFDTIAEFYGPGKPLLFTEWGGREIGQSEIIMPNTVDKLIDMTERGVLAGHCFWSWQDLPQFSRIDPEMREGTLESGVVTEGREPRQMVHMELTRLFEQRRHTGSPFVDSAAEGPVMMPLSYAPWLAGARIESVDLGSLVSSDRGAQAWKDFEARIAAHWKAARVTQWERTGKRFALWSQPAMEILGVRFGVPMVEASARPVVLTPDFPEVEIHIGKSCSKLHFLGHVTCPGGYPSDGAPGETVATYQIRYQNGQTHETPLRAGFEVAAANAIHEATRIDPVATSAQRAFWYIKDWAREHYQALLFSLSIECGRVESVRCRLHPRQSPLLLFAVFTESA